MKNLILLTFLLVLTCSCSHAGKWKAQSIHPDKMTWRICDKRYDKPELHQKGFCYKVKETKKRFFKKDIHRAKQLFCAWGDVACMREWRLLEKKLVRK
ncbi:MAG: hypothetical protein ACPGJV_02555 [Bacteriovoracaceae bacterium]